MPRLTNRNYLYLHDVLKHLWFHLHQIYGYIPHSDQRYLKEYYQLTVDLTDTELLNHRREISQLQPSLPQRAGRALSKLDRVASQMGFAITV